MRAIERQQHFVVHVVQTLEFQDLPTHSDTALAYSKLLTLNRDDGIYFFAATQQHIGCSIDLLCNHGRGVWLDNARFGMCDVTDGVAQVIRVIDADGRHHTHLGLHNVGRIPLATESDFDDRHIHRRIGEDRESKPSNHLEVGHKIGRAHV